MAVTVETRWYESGHGRQPKGEGHWMFQIGSQLFSFMGTYGQCKAAAMLKAHELHVERIQVLA
jgi:hypothetical protein